MESKNKIKRLISIFIALSFTINNINAQIGIGLPNPTNPVEIKTDAGNIIIDNSGKIGTLAANPKVALDLRNNVNGSVAIGNTNKTAAQAGAGALRYVASPAIGVKGYLEFSDGSNWVSFFS